jgi:DNA polymerase delta subunit 1
MEELRVAQHRFARLWTQCQECTENMGNVIECGAKDCPIFYMRQKARVDLEEKTNVVRRFNFYS